jgi:uncharacterized protein (DUF2062 family)
MMRKWLKRKLVDPLIALLVQGITPEKIALSLAFGIGLGVFPVLGSTTLLCALAALLFRLNLPAIQLVNYFIYPAQLALLLPFVRFGEWLFREPHMKLTVVGIFSLIRANVFHAIVALWTPTWHAMTAWLLIGPLVILTLYKILAPVLLALDRTIHPDRGAIKPEAPARCE